MLLQTEADKTLQTPMRTDAHDASQESEAGRNMSDGDNATPGRPQPSGPTDRDGDNQWLTRSPRPSPGAAPWERSGNSDPEEIADAGPTGNHTDGVTVADLIAKLNGDSSVPEELNAEPAPVRTANPHAAEPAAPPPPPRSSTRSANPRRRRDPTRCTEVIPDRESARDHRRLPTDCRRFRIWPARRRASGAACRASEPSRRARRAAPNRIRRRAARKRWWPAAPPPP